MENLVHTETDGSSRRDGSRGFLLAVTTMALAGVLGLLLQHLL
jgi:hypothetical protein